MVMLFLSIGHLPMKIWKYVLKSEQTLLVKPVSLIIMEDFNIDVTNRGIEFDKLDKFCDLFNLTNLITSPPCFTKTHKSTLI